ncbi:MAG TPA: hypothetical protein VKW04_16120 [Planctomycetota bacterium]|jgi:hypothetical protein|nr:hypothetical protein [Planctomycetota bacterium]
MKRIFGGLLMLAGALALYLFATRAMFHGRADLGSSYSPSLPLLLVGADYPTDALLLAGAAWGFLLGLWCVITGADEAREVLRGGRIARILLLNGLLLLSSLAIAYLGAKAHKDPATVLVFGLVAAVQAVVGLILLILSLAERPKGIASLAFGTVVTLGGVGLGVLVFLWGGA